MQMRQTERKALKITPHTKNEKSQPDRRVGCLDSRMSAM